MDKLISQQAAINVVSEITTTMSVCTNKDECYGMKRMQKQAITELANLPSVEPEAISKWKKEFREYVDSLDIARDDWKGIIEYIDELPSAQPERKTGRWIYGESEVGNDGYYCSECGNFVPWIYEESAMNFIREYKFCPNCGAKMEGGEADE